MNVHRRDRARLKQSPNPHTSEISHHDHDPQNHQPAVQNPFSSLGLQYPPKVCAFLYNPNPNSDHPVAITSSSSPPPVSAQLCTQDSGGQQALFPPPPPSSSVFEKHGKRSSGISFPQSLSNLSSGRYHHDSHQRNGAKNSRVVEAGGCRSKGDFVTTDLSVSLNLVVCRACPSMLSEGKEVAVGFKRRRTDDASSVSSFPKSSSVDGLHCQSEVLHEHSPRSIEDLDLELRLGDRPKVN